MSMNDFINMLNDEQKQALLKALVGDSPTVSSVPEEVKKESIKHIQSSTPTASVKEDFTIEKMSGKIWGKIAILKPLNLSVHHVNVSHIKKQK